MNAANDHIHKNASITSLVKQHLIDPELCASCGSCEAACPEGAVKANPTGYSYAIDPEKCKNGHECLLGCGTEAIMSWRMVPADNMYSLEEQYAWKALPPEIEINGQPVDSNGNEDQAALGHPAPASASKPRTFTYALQTPATVTIKSNTRATSNDADTDVHHIVLDFANTDFEWLEGQNIGVLPPGQTSDGHTHHMRAYSIASARDGENPHTREMALTIKRVIDEWDGKPYRGIASNFMCDLKPGDTVRCVGPIGAHFLMPQDPTARIMMICTGTGIAPMRSFIQRQQRLNTAPQHVLQLFYGGRTPDEMAYYDELIALPNTLLQTHMALSRTPSAPKRYVQDRLLEQSDLVANFLRDKNSFIFICGLVSMEKGVMDAFANIASKMGLPWDNMLHEMLQEGRLQIETY